MIAVADMLLAHQGGWDEMIFVAAPLILFGILLAIARRRVEAEDQKDDDRRRSP